MEFLYFSSPSKAQTSRLFRAVLNSLRRLTNFIIFLFTAYVGVVKPSLTNFVYFAAFLFISSWWATYKPLRHGVYNQIKKFLIFYSAIHFILIYTYQIPLVHTFWLPTHSFLARLFGLNVLMESKCPNYWEFPFVAPDLDNTNLMMKWPLYANPVVVLLFYYLTVAQFKFTRDGSRQYIDDNDFGSSVHEELLSSDTSTNHLQTGEAPQRDRSASPIRDGESRDAIPMRKVTSQVVDRNKLSHIFNVPGENESAASKGMIALISFVIYHSYSIALTAMMTWALLYHSIFGLILLITTCILWIFKDTRRTAFLVAPLLLIYVEFLLCFQYFLSLDIHQDIGDHKWITFLGINWIELPVHATMILMVQTLLSLPVFLLLRLARREKYYESLTDFERQRRINSYGTFGASKSGSGGVAVTKDPKSQSFAKFIEYLSHKITVYFVFLVALVLLIVATSFKPTFYTIGFFCIWALLVLYLKISFRLFRGVAYVFWLSLSFYTSLIIIGLYIFQFPGIASWVKTTTGLSDEWLKAIGLQDFSAIGKAGVLFLHLLSPIVLFVVTMLQLKFFHDPWIRATSRQTQSEAEQQAQQARSLEEGPSGAGDTLVKKLHKLANECVELLWRFFEVHISKIVFIIIACFVANNIYALYIPLVILLSLAICLPSAADGIFSILMCSYLFLVAIAKMIYQLDVIPELSKIDRGNGADNCTWKNTTMAEWFGLFKESQQPPILMLWGVIIAVVAMAFQSIIVYRQRYFRSLRGLPESLRARVFPDFHHSNYDHSLKHGVQFIIDYGFYKFGLEICLVAMGVDAWVRMDSLGASQCFWIVLFSMNKRPFVRRLWPIYLVYMAILYPLQFVIYVGLPPDSCIAYPWSNLLPNFSEAANHNLATLLDLPTYGQAWPPAFLLADFAVLLLAACQLNVFRREGEDNDSIYSDGLYLIKSAENPHYDFIDVKKSSVDYFKTLIFHYGHWITLAATLAAGIAGTSLFALGYIILTLWLLWQGNNLYVMNSRGNSFQQTLKRWNLILGYTLFTITMKVLLQMFGCVFLKWFESTGNFLCIIRQLFSITCIYNYGITQEMPISKDFEKSCPVDLKEAKIGYDVVALAFLVLQIRIFHSWYFQHCMVEYRSEVILANRGAVLKNQLIEKEMKEQNEQQKKKFNEIRRRTEAIRERYQKQQESGKETAEIIFEPKTYGQAKRAGDYYMFREDPEADDLVQPVDSFVPEVDPKATEYNRLDPGQIMYAATAHDMDLQKTLGQVKKGDQIKDAEERALEAVSEGKKNPEDPEEPDESKVESAVKFAQKMISSALDLCSVTLNKLCREHRYVGYVLSKEKQKLKAGHSESLSNTSRKLTEIRTDVDLKALQLVHSETDVDKMETEAVSDWQQKSSIMRFVNAVVNCIGAHTDILCYFFSIMTQVMTGGLLTMPLPLMALFWGNLSNPRPSKFFWVTMITYTEFVIVIKFICQFQFFTFNSTEYITQNNLNPVSVDKVIGVSKRDYFALWDIILLFSLFFHRYMLRKLGLWKDANLTDTFLSSSTSSTENSANSEPRVSTGKELDTVETTVDETQKESSLSQGTTSNSEITIYSADPVVVTQEPVQTSEEGSKVGPIGRFIQQLFHPKFRYIRDLYPIMFGIDVICFLTITFGYSSFGEGGSGNVLNDVKASRIPVTLVVMLVGMTLAIIVDRALYLRKSVLGKLIYQIFMITFLHIWMFLVLPEMTTRAAINNKVAQALYVMKSCYFLVSAWQIRNGYPELCIGNLLTHSYGMINMIAFKVFMLIPFLFELRTAIDWTWTDTSMPLMDFFNMENFYAHIFNLKCARQFEADYPAPRGVAKGKLVKYMMGFPLIIGVVLFIWSPLLLVSLLNQIGTISMPVKVTLRVSIEGYPPLYEMEAQGQTTDNRELQTMSWGQYQTLTDIISKRYQARDTESILRSRMSGSYLKGFTPEDILIVRFRPESEVYWPISQDSINAMINKLEGNSSANFQVTLAFTRPYNSNDNAALTHSKSYLVPIDQSPDVRAEIIKGLKGGDISTPITIKTALPSYIQVPNSGELTLPTAIGNSIVLDSNGGYPADLPYADLGKAWFDTLKLTLKPSSTQNTKVWLLSQIHPGLSNDTMFLPAEKTSYGGDRDYIQVVGFVDRAFPSFLAAVYKGGVIAMYLSVVVVVGRGVVRGLFTSQPSSVMFNELPNADHLLKICLDVYLVREAKDFFLEQDLFAKLIFLFRSPATLIEWTRMSKKKLE
ncbi:unnamed protein product [Caenorhabditis angaria]|uniref:Piezo-type mechanosensitive ion channel component n=1 Tax=Caenorhabditis angaria TaxID=860376 RepID=A0A9P1ILZ5_9PELO|nr:unnamed protein product [Caenorhabditis angaria]